jgi:hypothetical protein
VKGERTQHPQQVFRSIDRTHVLLLSHLHFGTRDISLADLSILRAFEAIKEVGAKGAVKVDRESGDDGREDEVGVA